VVFQADVHFHIYVNSRFYKSRLLKTFLDHYGCIPVYVEKQKNAKRKNKKAFQKAKEYLGLGEIVGVFPEGRRSLDGKLKKAKLGAAKLALSAKVPVIPIGIIGSYELFPKGKKFPKLKKSVIVNIGKPIYFNKYYGKDDDNKALENVTRKIMQEIGKLSRQKYNH
jgi:1-acyl-sn-glycerol-3-phosphate acyltransferase